RRRHTRLQGDWSSDVCSSDLVYEAQLGRCRLAGRAARAPGLRACLRMRPAPPIARQGTHPRACSQYVSKSRSISVARWHAGELDPAPDVALRYRRSVISRLPHDPSLLRALSWRREEKPAGLHRRVYAPTGDAMLFAHNVGDAERWRIATRSL